MNKEENKLYKVWTKFGCPTKIVYPEIILEFLNESIKVTNGLLNVDFYGGGFADNICKVEYKERLFHLYWKDFEENFKNYNNLSESEKITIATFGNNTYIYQLMDIRSLEILECRKNIYIVVRCNYVTMKEFYKYLNANMGINKQNITELKAGHYVELLFKDTNGYNHSCQLIPFPINSLLIQEKNNPISENSSRKIMDSIFINEFNEIYEELVDKESRLKDYENSREIQALGSEIRIETERLLKYYILRNVQNLDFEEFNKLCDELLEKYSSLQLGKLKNKAHGLEIPQSFINILNVFAHDNGKNLFKKDLRFLFDNFGTILKENFRQIHLT
ncbi:hypothetical protein [Bacillus subtilis]|uniref:hypothetical protein n=2 Tax=Bacillus subtilis TaxID=1423 RepID=UPI001B9D62CB|nr:hypothetical protein [Bacillus subtilis]CAF1812300.1 hypothetical protein NRS6148_01001 [Bacillus subtilis]